MVRFPNCKINLGLHIIGKRADGYHNLETVFYPLQLKDALEILPAPHLSEPEISLSGLPVSGNDSNNLCIKAWHLIKRDFPAMPAVSVHLHKAIPMGAGLGGGSADGAFMLQMLNDQFRLQLAPETLAKYALQLGSDCPFFIYNTPMYGTGRGEILQPVPLRLHDYFFYIINPGIHISTAAAFQRLTYKPHPTPLSELIQQPVDLWKDKLVNDFETGMAVQHPDLADIKQQLYNHGAVYAAMSGSGSTMFGVFREKPATLSFPEQYVTHILAAQ